MHNVEFNFSQKLPRKIIKHLIAVEIDDKLIPTTIYDIQKKVLNAIDDQQICALSHKSEKIF